MGFFLNFQKRYVIFSIIYLLHANVHAQQQKAESFFAYDFNNQDFYFSEELDKGKPIFINFFATWCSPCLQELPFIEELHKDNPEVSFFIIHVDNLSQNNIRMKEPSPNRVFKILRERISFSKDQLLYDKYAVVARKYKVNLTGLPASYLISKEGFIVSSYKKIDSELIKKIQKDINRL